MKIGFENDKTNQLFEWSKRLNVLLIVVVVVQALYSMRSTPGVESVNLSANYEKKTAKQMMPQDAIHGGQSGSQTMTLVLPKSAEASARLAADGYFGSGGTGACTNTNYGTKIFSLEGVQVRSGNWIDAIRFKGNNGWSDWFGGNGGTLQSEQEWGAKGSTGYPTVNQVSWRYNSRNYVKYLEFKVSAKSTCDTYSFGNSASGALFFSRNMDSLGYIHVASGTYVDCLTFTYFVNNC